MEVEYAVRGAMVYCNKGTHPRRLNLPQCHGVYTLGKPMIQDTDCMAVTNISYFGVCMSASPPKDTEQVVLAGYVKEGGFPSFVKDVQGLKCNPEIIGKWKCGNKKANITGEFASVTTNSYLVCACGGLIQFQTSGQEFEE
jgi:hypothetical protein